MIIAISQPTFLPYEGYFALISNVEKFIFLDNVQFDKRSWQQRNYLTINNKPKLITIPVLTKGKFNQKINEVLIDYKNFDTEKFLNMIFLSYKREKYFEEFFHIVESIFREKKKYLSDLNINLINAICKYTDINTEISMASELKDTNKFKKAELLKHILVNMKCDVYYSSIGAKKYLGNSDFFPQTKIKIKYFSYESKIKVNENLNFSILDFIFKNGKKIKNNFKNNFKLIN